MTAPIPLDVFADICCPWCLIGFRRLEAALADLPEGTFEVRHRAFELQPQLPPRGIPMREFMLERFGSEERLAGIHAQVAAQGARDGIAFAFDALAVMPNTRVAHRAIALARDQDFERPAVEALYLAYFTEGRDITDAEVVVAALAATGLPDAAGLTARLAAGEGEESVAEDELLAAQIRTSGVPLVIADRRLALEGAQDPTVYARFLAQALQDPQPVAAPAPSA